MKKFILIFLLLLLFFNEFTFYGIEAFQNIQIYFINLGNLKLYHIRYFNFINILLLVLVYFYYEDFLKLSLIKKGLFCFLFLITIDFISGFVGFGYKFEDRYKSEIYRKPSPYEMFSGKPNILEHNEFGFRGISPNQKFSEDKLIIAFFGGSTGYNGDPAIVKIISDKLNTKDKKIIHLNFSSVSSNHNQHLHRLVKFSEFKFDVVIFYGGANELLNNYYYDPRPGYPFNFMIREADLTPIEKFLLQYSNIVSEFDKMTGRITKLSQLQKKERDKDFNKWINEVSNNYYLTVQKAELISKKIVKPNICRETIFVQIFQPFKSIEDNTDKLIQVFKNDIRFKKFLDLSYLTNELNFSDLMHVDQMSKYKIAENIVPIIKKLDNC